MGIHPLARRSRFLTHKFCLKCSQLPSIVDVSLSEIPNHNSGGPDDVEEPVENTTDVFATSEQTLSRNISNEVLRGSSNSIFQEVFVGKMDLITKFQSFIEEMKFDVNDKILKGRATLGTPVTEYRIQDIAPGLPSFKGVRAAANAFLFPKLPIRFHFYFTRRFMSML